MINIKYKLTIQNPMTYTTAMVSIGSRLKKRRLECRITLKDLAEKCEVTSSFLSQMEKGKTTPSLSTLSRIASALDFTIGEIVDGEITSKPKDNHPVVRLKQRKTLQDDDLDMTMYVLSEQMKYKMMETMIFSFHKKSSDNGFRFQHFGQEFALVMRGTIEVILGKETHILGKGDSIYFDSSIPHVFINPQEGLTEVLSVNTPPSF